MVYPVAERGVLYITSEYYAHSVVNRMCMLWNMCCMCQIMVCGMYMYCALYHVLCCAV